MPKKVVVLGGGVAGLSAAHELMDRGFVVELYEASDFLGGKARSHPVSGTGTGGRLDLPGEHGFRFYPSFYRHLIDTMERIPLQSDSSKNVAQGLKSAEGAAIAAKDGKAIHEFTRKRPDSPYSVIETIELFFNDMDVGAADVSMFGLKVLQYLSSCDERRDDEYEKISWWEFLQGHRFSPKFQKFMRSIPRTMVAMDPEVSSARTIGTISMQLILDFAGDGVNNDRTMGGPTSEMWIDHWEQHLLAGGVTIHRNKKVNAIDLLGGEVSKVHFVDGSTIAGDYYILAVPLDVAKGLMTTPIAALDPQLDRLQHADTSTLLAWMVGIQFFLYEDVPMVPGHVFYPDSLWALTSISQAQFWREEGLFRKRYGDGSVGGVISVDISEWGKPGHDVLLPARDASADEVAHEVWEQMKRAVNETGKTPILTDENLHSYHIDDDMEYSPGGVAPVINHAPLLVHPPGSWALRPKAHTAIANFFLASDFVRTNTDLATMEGANEAARRAVNAILDADGSSAAKARLWKLQEPSTFDSLKKLDKKRFLNGKSHIMDGALMSAAFRAGEIGRTIGALTGLSQLDDFLDDHKFTDWVEDRLKKLGIR